MREDESVNAWGVPILRYSEEDVVKQKFIQTIHRVEWRDRSNTQFSDPDLVEGLRLHDSDSEEEVEISRTDDKSGSDGRSNVSESDPETQKEASSTGALIVRGEDSQPEEDIYAPGTYCGLLFDGCVRDLDLTGEKMVVLLEERLKTLRGVPRHLHRYVKPIKIELPVGSRVKKVSGGDDHALILLESDSEVLETLDPTYTDHHGRVLVVGSDACSQLGLKTSRRQDVPVNLDTIGDTKIHDIAAGGRHSVAVSTTQECLTWGKDSNGCTGHGQVSVNFEHHVPKWMYWVTNATTKVLTCAAGDSHTVITTTEGSVYSFGAGSRGQLGHGDGMDYSKPKLVSALNGLSVSSISCGGNHTLVVTESGILYGFGSNSHGQLACDDFSDVFLPRRMGHDDLVGGKPKKVDVEEIYLDAQELEQKFIDEMNKLDIVDAKEKTKEKHRQKVIQVVGGRAHTVILTDTGRVYVCGAGGHGQLGLHSAEDRSSLTLLSAMTSVSINQIAAGDLHTVMLTTLGDVFVCGANDFGQLGNGSVTGSNRPQRIQPVVSNDERSQKKKSEIDECERHPLYGVKAERVYASKSCTFVVPRGSQSLFICGSGAFGHPKNEHPTNLFEMMSEPLTKWNETQLLVIGSTFANLKMDEHIFQNLVKQMVMYGVYHERVLAHIFKDSFTQVLRYPHLCSVYVNMIKMMKKHSLGCTVLSFRRLVMFGIEDVGVRLLDARNEAQRRRLLRDLGLISFQKFQTNAEDINLQQRINTYVSDRAGYADFEQFKNHCLILKRFVRELLEADVLTRQDLEDMRVGFPGSTHSISLSSSVDAEQKLHLFDGIASLNSSKRAATRDRRTGRSAVPSLLTTCKEDAAWGHGILMPDKNTWKSYAKNAAEEKNIRASYHGISTTSQSNNRCESMLSPSTRNVYIIDGDIAKTRKELFKFQMNR